MSKYDYSVFDSDILIYHKLTKRFPLSWYEVFQRYPTYDEIKQLIKLSEMLEQDPDVFHSAPDIATYKHAARESKALEEHQKKG